MTIKLTELPYQRDTSVLFATIAHEPWSIFLDSGYPYIDIGRYDLIAARPVKTLVTYSDKTIITSGDGAQELSTEDPFQLLKKHLGPRQENLTGLPFGGGDAPGDVAHPDARPAPAR